MKPVHNKTKNTGKFIQTKEHDAGNSVGMRYFPFWICPHCQQKMHPRSVGNSLVYQCPLCRGYGELLEMEVVNFRYGSRTVRV